MAHFDPFQEAHDRIFEHEAFYRDAVHSDGTNDKSCKILLDFNLTKWGEVVTIGTEAATLTVRTEELTVRPRRGHTFTQTNGREWTVDQVDISDGYVYQCLVVDTTE